MNTFGKVIIASVLVGIMVLLVFFSEELKAWLEGFISGVDKIDEFLGFILLFLCGNLIILVGLPIAYYEFLLGFTFKSLLKAFCLATMIKIAATFITFFIARKWLKSRIVNRFRKKSFYKGLKIFIESEKLWHLFAIRLLFIPLCIKNYLLPTFEISAKVYFAITVPIDALAGIWLVFLGFSLKNFSSENWQNMENMRFLVFFIVSIAILAYITYFTR